MVLFVYLLGRRLGGPAVGVVGALLAAIYPAFIDNSEQFVSEPIAAFRFRAPCSRCSGRPIPADTWTWLLPGALLGATALTRPEYLMFAVLLGLVVVVKVARGRGVRVGLASAAVRAAFALVLVPGRCATTSCWTASCRSRPAAARRSSSRPTCPGTGASYA